MDDSGNFCNEDIYFVKMKHRCKVPCVKIADLLGSQYLFEILQISLIVKNSENMVKSGCFKNLLQWKDIFLKKWRGDVRSLG